MGDKLDYRVVPVPAHHKIILNNFRKLRISNTTKTREFYKQLFICYIIPVIITLIMWSLLSKKDMIRVYSDKILPDSTLSADTEKTLLTYGFIEIALRILRLIFFVGVCVVIWRSNRSLRALGVAVNRPPVKTMDRLVFLILDLEYWSNFQFQDQILDSDCDSLPSDCLSLGFEHRNHHDKPILPFTPGTQFNSCLLESFLESFWGVSEIPLWVLHLDLHCLWKSVWGCLQEMGEFSSRKRGQCLRYILLSNLWR